MGNNDELRTLRTLAARGLTKGLAAFVLAVLCGALALGPRTADAAPTSWDDDSDGVDNATESAYGTDPYNPDGDSDGLLDGEEVWKYGIDPHDPDTDHDGLRDGEEIAFGFDPLRPDW